MIQKRLLFKIMIVLMDLTKKCVKKGCSEVTQKKTRKQIYVFINNLQKFQVDYVSEWQAWADEKVTF